MHAGGANVGNIEQNVSWQFTLEVHIPHLGVRRRLISWDENHVGSERRNGRVGRLHERNSLRHRLNWGAESVGENRSSSNCDIEGRVLSEAIGDGADRLVDQLKVSDSVT